MFSCMWKDAVESWPQHLESIKNEVGSSSFLEVVEAWTELKGLIPHPKMVLQEHSAWKYSNTKKPKQGAKSS